MAKLREILFRIRSMEEEWVQELHRMRGVQGYHLEGQKIHIEEATRKAHRLRRKRLYPYLMEIRLSALVTAPVIWGALLPALLIDAYVSLYQWVCFPAYGIPRVKRRDFMVMDRRHLPYLNGLEKLNCFYCSYFNGMIAYVQEVAARTEQHWCPIKHARHPRTLHGRYYRFFDYGDAETFRAQYEELRRDFAGPTRSGSKDPLP